jgi:FkbM family methyltransferase
MSSVIRFSIRKVYRAGVRLLKKRRAGALPMIRSGQILFGPRDSIYSTLAFLEPGLVVDVGAADGSTVSKVLATSPGSRVIAFEPFPGNLALLRARVGKRPNVTIIPKAVTNRTGGSMRFHVPNVRKRDGGSSTGLLVSQADTRSRDAIDVDVTALSIEVKERVRFLKIDTQGGEPAVLRGAEALIERYGVDMMLVEFFGQKEIPWRLLKLGYVLFDSRMFIAPLNGAKLDPAAWVDLSPVGLSTGRGAYVGWPTNAPRDPMAYCKFMHDLRRNVGYVWTDLIAVHQHFMPTFLKAVAQVRERGNDSLPARPVATK